MRESLIKIKTRLAERTDTEHHQAILRLVIGTAAAVTLFANWASIEQRGHFFEVVLGLTAFYIVTLGIIAHICVGPQISIPRRYLGIISDVAFVTTTLILGQEPSTQGVVMIYLWIILGNGLRFGPSYLLLALALSLFGFLLLWMNVPFWRENSALFVEVVIGQIAVAVYMRSLVVRLNRAVEREAAANSAKGVFVSRMSHEMRTPLNSIVGSVELILDNKIGPREQRELLNTARTAAKHLSGLINDVLDFSKIEANKLTLELGDTDLRSLMWSTARMMQAQAQAKNIGIDIHIEAGVPFHVIADELRLRQVLINLMGNALKFTHAGYVRIEAYVVERASAETAKIRFAVRDTGIGIPDEKQDKIFDSFVQADERITREYGGTGLGLTITQSLVQLMGGMVEVESEVGRGSIFSFVLPLNIDSSKPVELNVWALVGFSGDEQSQVLEWLNKWGLSGESYPNTGSIDTSSSTYRGAIVNSQFKREFIQAEELCAEMGWALVLCTGNTELHDDPLFTDAELLHWPADRFSLLNAIAENTIPSLSDRMPIPEATRQFTAPGRLHILIVDDTPSNLVVARATVESAGYTCETTPSPHRALDMCAESHFDLLICDRNMPEMEGVTLIKELRHLEAMGSSRMPVIMLTGDATDSARQEAIAAGADAFLIKPIRPSDLNRTITELTAQRPPHRPTLASTAQTKVVREEKLVVDADTIRDLASIKPDDPDFVANAQQQLIDDCYGWMTKVAEALAARDIGTIREAVHAIKGSAGMVGMLCLTDVCDHFVGLKAHEIDTRGTQFERELKMAVTVAEEYLVDLADKRALVARDKRH